MEVSLIAPSKPYRGRCWNLSLSAAGALLAAGLLAGCSGDDPPIGPGPVGPVGPVGDETGIAGSGNVVSESRDVGDFAGIVFASEGAVIITQAEKASLVIEADDNLQQHLHAAVDGNVLEVSTADGVDIAPSNPPVFRIGIDNVTAIDLAGVGTIDVASIGADRLEMTLSGVGDITIGTVAVTELTLNLGGVGTVSATGTADRLDAMVAGASVLSAADLETQTATIHAADTGDAIVWVSDDLEATAIDMASIEYYGTPSVTKEVAGTANVASLGAK